jgi:hypothetical protein
MRELLSSLLLLRRGLYRWMAGYLRRFILVATARGLQTVCDPAGTAAPRPRLAHDAVLGEDEPHSAVSVRANGAAVCEVLLAGRATSVPVTAVLLGPERTTTDNTTRP